MALDGTSTTGHGFLLLGHHDHRDVIVPNFRFWIPALNLQHHIGNGTSTKERGNDAIKLVFADNDRIPCPGWDLPGFESRWGHGFLVAATFLLALEQRIINLTQLQVKRAGGT